MKNIRTRLADWIGGLTTIRCPHCPTTLSFRSLNGPEEKRLRNRMTIHIDGHRQTP